MNAADIAAALGGSHAGDSWIARCPAHDDSRPSLSIRDGAEGKVLVHCHAGCDQTRVIVVLRMRGLWPSSVSSSRLVQPAVSGDRAHCDTSRAEWARRIWREAVPAANTLVEIYLRARGVTMLTPPTLRFSAGLRHSSGGIWPAMVALVTCARRAVGIHRTFMARDGSNKAPVERQKMMLGPCKGGAVRLAPAAELLMVGEGIETCLAAMQATGQPAWAALSTAGLRTLDLPPEVQEVVVLADGDDAGEAAAVDAALRWKRQGRRVRIARPPRGLDFNDLLLGRAPRCEGGAA